MNYVKRCMAAILVLLLLISYMFTVDAVSVDELNAKSVFLKQQTGVTCTLSAAAMMVRRTAFIEGRNDWDTITEESIRETAWYDGVGLLWNFTYSGIKVSHGYFDKTADVKKQIVDMLDKYPQGIVVYNGGNLGQSHAIIALDYDKNQDVLYVADPASYTPEGRIKISDSSIKGSTQTAQINNLTAFWYVSYPDVSGKTISACSSDKNLTAFNESKKITNHYYKITSKEDVATRNLPTGSSAQKKTYKTGDIVKVLYTGKNVSGAIWCQLSDDTFVYAENISLLCSVSNEIIKFESTKKAINAEYYINASEKNPAYFYAEPVSTCMAFEKLSSKKQIHITFVGKNCAGKEWAMTEDGMFVDMAVITKTSASASACGFYGITASSLNLRSSPINGTVLASIPNGVYVYVCEIKNSWGKTSYKNVEGWISLDYAKSVMGSSSSGGSADIVVESTTAVPRPVATTSASETTTSSIQAAEIKNIITCDMNKVFYNNNSASWTVTSTLMGSNITCQFSLLRNGAVISSNDVSCTQKNGFTTANFSSSLSSSGTYKVVAVIKKGTTSYTVTSDTIVVYAPLSVKSLDLSRSPTGSGYSTVVFSCEATGGKAPYKYRYIVNNGTETEYDSQYSENNSFEYCFNRVGTYCVSCIIKDSGTADVSVDAPVITVSPYLTGDVTGDGKISAADARLALRASAKLEDFSDIQKAIGDVDDDKKITASDARLILRVSAHIDVFPKKV